MTEADPFETAALRRAVLQAWESSPTRFREDSNAEEDLRLGGYRDRLLVELAQNAADAARDDAGGGDGVLRVELSGAELRVANTGSPLSSAGVASLASLRASAKRGGTDVGRFGVGFAAVLSVSDEPRIVSSTGSVAFSAERTRDAVVELPGAAEELAARSGEVPVLRLVWPSPEQPPRGFTTEVRLPLLSEGVGLLDAFADQAADLLLALPALAEITIGGQTWRRDVLGADRITVRGPLRSDSWLLHRASGQLGESMLADLGVEARHASGWQACWAVPLDEDGMPIPLAEDVLHAPTVTEERLSLPARLLASLPLEPDRRRVASSAATDAVLAHAAETYPELVAKIAPEHRPVLAPIPGFPLSDVDDRLRQAVIDRLRVTPWLPSAAGGMVTAQRARVLDFVAPDVVDLLSDVVPGLLTVELSDARHRRALSGLEVRRIGAAELVEAVTGLERPAPWWQQLYAALAPIAGTDAQAREELAALPVPLADGRTVTGVRDVLLAGDEGGPAALLSTLDVSGLRIADPAAEHPLLEQLGARRSGPAELLDAAPLADAVRGSVADGRAGGDVLSLTEAVLGLVAQAHSREWLGALALPDADGDVRRADELLLPNAAMHEVIDPECIGADAPLSVLDAEFAERWPTELLCTIGVLDSFAVLDFEEPAEPPEQFPDVEQWWREQETARPPDQWPPAHFVGVRDLDLVADDAWPAALRLLTARPETLGALREPDSYTGWWIARFAVFAGYPPRHWRLPGASEIEGLYDAVPDTGLAAEHLRLAGVRGELQVSDTEDAADLIERLGDANRTISVGTALRAHGVLADAASSGVIEVPELAAPDSVRSISGAVVGSGHAVVLDEPWMLGVLEAPLVIAGGSPDGYDAEALAEVLDLPLASEETAFRVASTGRAQQWRDVGRVSTSCELLGIPVPVGEVVLHDELRVGASAARHRVHWWVEGSGAVHAERTPDGLARALAWAAGSWSQRFAFAALLSDPDAVTLLR